jgi:hypothetical protein
MAETAPEIRALAFVVHHIRPTWPRTLIEAALASDNRDLGTLARAAVMAAQNPSTRHPNGITTTFPGADTCTVCDQRARSQTTQPPPVTRCARCGRATEHDHACRSVKPPWWPQAQAITNRYATAIRAARAVGDHATVAELAANQRTELAKVMSHA